MRVGINLLYLLPGVVGGTQTYATGLLHGLAELDHDDEYVLYLNRESATLALPESRRFRKVVCPVNATRRAARYAWEQFVLPLQAKRDRLDVLHSLGYVGPVYAPCPHIVSIHDMNFIDIPQSVRGLRQKVLDTLVQRAADRAAFVITISEFSRGRIIHHLGLDPDRVIVTHLAGRDPGADAPLSRTQVPRPCIVAFSSQHPHKNITRLIEAFARIAEDVPHSLVLVGHLPADGEVVRAIESAGLGKRVVITGYIPDSDIMPLIRGADLFAFPSVYEGFGLPLLDAQSLGVPVVGSTAASIPEVAGDGALYFDPLDTEDMAATIRRVLTDPALAADLRARGTRNVARFTWESTAARTHRVYQEALTAQNVS